MGLESLGFVGLIWAIVATPTGVAPAPVPLAAILFVIGLGQGLALPTLMRMVTGRVGPALSGMIAGIASSTLQVSAALSVAAIGGIFYAVLGTRHRSGGHHPCLHRRHPLHRRVPRRRRCSER